LLEGGVLISTLRSSAFLCVSALNGFFTAKDAELRRGRRERLFKLSHYLLERCLDTPRSGAYSFFAYVAGLLMLSRVLLLLSKQRDRDAVCKR
jgi:hypothetical protein